jgi:hypothetical protein
MTGNAAPRVRGGPLPSSRPTPHPCRTDLDREEDRILDQVRPRSARADPRPPPPCRFLPPEQHLRLRPLGGQRLRHDHLAHRHRARGRARRAYQTLPFVRPAATSCSRSRAGRRSKTCCATIDAIEALGIDPAPFAPDHWRHVHNRSGAGQEPRAYTPERHRAWLKRRRIGHEPLRLRHRPRRSP